jgi:MFS family permease
MQFVALNWQIYVLTHSAFALGLIGFFRFIPILFFSLIGGSVADAHNRKKILAITQTTLTVLSAALVITTLTHTISPQIIFSITALSAVALAFDTPAMQAIIPSLVDKRHIPNAMSLNFIMFQTATILGPSLAGFLIAKTGLGFIYALNAFSFLFVLFSLWLLHTSGEIEGIPTKISLKAMQEGLYFVKRKTIIWSTMLLDFFSTFFASATALIPVYAKDILAVGPTGLGLLYAAPAIGAVLAGIFATQQSKASHQGYILLISVAFYALGTLIFGVSHTFWLAFVGLILVGAGDSISSIIRNVIRQLETPDYIRGRMTAINMIFFLGGPQLGDFEAGVLASAIGAPFSVITGGMGTFIVVAAMAVMIPKLRNYDKHESLKL